MITDYSIIWCLHVLRMSTILSHGPVDFYFVSICRPGSENCLYMSTIFCHRAVGMYVVSICLPNIQKGRHIETKYEKYAWCMKPVSICRPYLFPSQLVWILSLYVFEKRSTYRDNTLKSWPCQRNCLYMSTIYYGNTFVSICRQK